MPMIKSSFACKDGPGRDVSVSSAGIWTDGRWVFSTGLDQRIRCWHLEQQGKLIEHEHMVVSVPEPEALDASARGRNRYQIAVAGRGMQMFDFVAPDDMKGGN
ncbi:hypothetical protein T459_02422 [Capsicum annuum]|uniref:Uncharacterized protein n=1 Tax=Capsicum annuum TaxID=4072 RepID=A0A2G3AK07_CAPAN|nr:hypothetical protein T459_02422 [Capsicum annuum]